MVYLYIGDQVVAELPTSADWFKVGCELDDRPIPLEAGERLVFMLMPFVQCLQECLVGSSNRLSFECPVFIVAVGFCLSYCLCFLRSCPRTEVSLFAILLRMS
jgi:hypothetical protein